MAIAMKVIILAAMIQMAFASQIGIEPPKHCQVEDFGYTSWVFEYWTNSNHVDDNYVGEVAKMNTSYVKTAEITNGKYLKAELIDGYLVISTTEEIKSFELNEKGSRITELLTITCEDKPVTTTTTEASVTPPLIELRHENPLEPKVEENAEYSLRIHQDLRDVNTYTPEFIKKDFRYVFYSDLVSSRDLGMIDTIAAVDFDMSTSSSSGLKFTITEESNFTVTSAHDKINDKQINAVLTPKTRILAPFEQTFTIVATDYGQPESKSDSAKVTVIVRENPDTIVFTQALYRAVVVDKEAVLGNHPMIVENGPVAMVGGFGVGTLFELLPTAEESFFRQFEVIATSRDVQVRTTRHFNATQLEEQQFVTLEVTADYFGRKGHFAVLVEHPRETSWDGTDVDLDGFDAWLSAVTTTTFVAFGILVAAFLLIIANYIWGKNNSK